MRALPTLAAAVMLVLPGPAAAGLRKGPYVQQVTSTSAVVMFELATPAPAAVRVRAGREATGAGAEWVIRAPPATLHEVPVTGLSPSRRYAFTVEAGGARERGEIVTAPLAHEAFSFIVWGDTRSGDEIHRELCARLALETPDFIIHTGDLVPAGADLASWQTFFDIERELMRAVPVYPVMGNHDYQGVARRDENFRRYFSLPPDSPNPERYYAFSWGNSRLIVLDTTEPSFSLAEQTLWLEEQLAAAAASAEVSHIFVTMHHPLYSTATHGPLAGARLAWAPLLERYRVDLVFAGHDHVYERLTHGGLRYITTGGGGAPLYFQRREPAAEDGAASLVFDRSYHYARVHVAGDFVEVAVVALDGRLIDGFTLGARPTGACRTAGDCHGLVHASCEGAWRCAGQVCSWPCEGAGVAAVTETTPAPAPAPPLVAAPGGAWATSGRALWLGLLGLCLAGAAFVLRRHR
jgi:predicted phosphodiesterase